MAAKAGKELSALVKSLAIKSSEVDAAPHTVLVMLRRIFNTKDAAGAETDILSQEFPRLNTSSIVGDDNYVETNGYCERYEAPITEPGKETKLKKLNFFTSFWQSTDEGKAQLFVLAQIKMCRGNDRAKAEKFYRDMDNAALDTLEKNTKRAASRSRSYVRKAIGVYFVMMDLLNITDNKGNLVVTLDESANQDANSFPYDLVNIEKQGRQYRNMNVTDILKLDVAAARAEGGSLYEKLLAQLERDTQQTKTKYPLCENAEQILDAASAIVNGLLDNDDLNTAIKAAMGKKKTGLEYLRMIGALRGALNGIWSKSLQLAYDRSLDTDIEHVGDETETERTGTNG